jgi:hypothetical protein
MGILHISSLDRALVPAFAGAVSSCRFLFLLFRADQIFDSGGRYAHEIS